MAKYLKSLPFIFAAFLKNGRGAWNRYGLSVTGFLIAADGGRGSDDMGMTFGQFSQANRARCESPQGFNHPLSGWSTSDWITATMGELGEAANVVKKLNRYRDGVPGNKVSEAELRDQLRKEIGDVFVYLDLMAQSLGFSIADAAAEVFNSKSAEIGYPTKL
jgi:NTP pyrophosphatase (non-canonical NTP hydrolase)